MPGHGALILITAFEVPPGADEQFLAGWERSQVAGAAVLLRALRADVDFRFVSVASEEPLDATPFPGHRGAYEVVREDGAPDTRGGVVLVEPFEVPPAGDEPFLAAWDGARAAVSRQQGQLGARLHRSAGAADFRFVHIGRWSSPLMFARALKRPEIADAATAMRFPSRPALYLPAAGA
jgi:heme-degrading monooxygenase HmoA